MLRQVGAAVASFHWGLSVSFWPSGASCHAASICENRWIFQIPFLYANNKNNNECNSCANIYGTCFDFPLSYCWIMNFSWSVAFQLAMRKVLISNEMELARSKNSPALFGINTNSVFPRQNKKIIAIFKGVLVFLGIQFVSYVYWFSKTMNNEVFGYFACQAELYIPYTISWVNFPLMALWPELFGNFKSSSYEDWSLSFLW